MARASQPAGSGLLRLVVVCLAVAGVMAGLKLALRKPALGPDTILSAWDEGARHEALSIRYPLDETLFPAELPPPAFRWDDPSTSDTWLVTFRFREGEPESFLVPGTAWTPADPAWETIKRRTTEEPARVTVLGVARAAPDRILSAASITLTTSRDEVGAPIFYREVNLPFEAAVKDPAKHIRWRFGAVSSREPPPVVLEGIPTCANCHSFSADGSLLAMEVDSASDKGSYVITPVEAEMVFEPSGIITWSDYDPDDEEITLGTFAQISPDGRHVVCPVKDRPVFTTLPDLSFSQLFFPVKGILAFFRRETGTFHALPGADDKRFVQTNPTWSPDGKHIVFARHEAFDLKTTSRFQLLLQPHDEQIKGFVSGEKTFRYDLYRIPFNDGAGGQAEPLEGASNNGASNYFARYSPDGRWIVFCKANSFMLLQPDSQLHIMPAEGGQARRMRCNTPRMNSWHSWSPNSRWLVFSSKARGDPYTQLYLTHVDEQGRDTPPVLLDRFSVPERAVNIPEFVNARPDAIRRIRQEFLDDNSFLRAATNLAVQHKEYELSIRYFDKALAENPDNARAHGNLGNAYFHTGKRDLAEREYRRAMELDSSDLTPHYNLAGMLHSRGRLVEAEAVYRTIAGLVPDDAKPHVQLGRLYVETGDLAQAEASFSRAVQLAPDSPWAHLELGRTIERLGRPEQALEQLRLALRYTPRWRRDSRSVAEHLRSRRELRGDVLRLLDRLREDGRSAGIEEPGGTRGRGGDRRR